jgi:hypothetical protein
MADEKRSLLREEIEADIESVFLNPDEFGEVHYIEGKPLVCILASDNTLPISGGYRLGISDAQIDLYVAAKDLKQKPAGQMLIVDTKQFQVDDWKVDMGIAHVKLSRSVGI